MRIFAIRKQKQTTPVAFQSEPVSQYSSLTAPMPRHIPKGRAQRIVFRTIATAAIVSGLIAMMQSIRTKSLGKNPLAPLLYQIHDSVYLPLKGYTFELFFPNSLIWYGFATSMFLLWLVFYLTDRSLVRRPHIALLRRTVAVGLLRVPLVGVSRVLLRVGLSPDQMHQVVQHERDLALLRLAAGDQASGQRLKTLTRLLIDLSLLYDQRRAILQAVCDWQEAMLILRASDNPAARSLAPHIVPTIARTLRTFGLTPIDALTSKSPGLDVVHCLTDALRLALIAGAELSSLKARGAPHVEDMADRDSLVRELAWAVEWRREQIDQLRARFEQAFAHPFAQITSNTTNQGYIPVSPVEELPLLGRLALSASLAAACELRSNEMALSIVESIDALVIALACLGQTTPLYLVETARCARAWVGNGPTSSDRQLMASFDQNRVAALYQAWKPYLNPAGPIRSADLALVDRHNVDMFRAAGLGHETNILNNSQDERL